MSVSLIAVIITLHVLADFYFQTDKIAGNKLKSYRGVLIHGAQYGIAYLPAFLFIRFNVLFLLVLLLTVLAHFLIDSLKYWMSRQNIFEKIISKKGIVFVADQMLHIVSMLMIVLMYLKNASSDIFIYGLWSDMLSVVKLDPELALKWLLLVLLIIRPANIVFQLFFQNFKPQGENACNENIEQEDVRVESTGNRTTRDENSKNEYGRAAKKFKAGAIIGVLERLLIVFFISINQYSALGFILTAKSIARYDAITKDRKFAEYYLIGTLMSVVLSIAAYTLVFKGL